MKFSKLLIFQFFSQNRHRVLYQCIWPIFGKNSPPYFIFSRDDLEIWFLATSRLNQIDIFGRFFFVGSGVSLNCVLKSLILANFRSIKNRNKNRNADTYWQVKLYMGSKISMSCQSRNTAQKFKNFIRQYFNFERKSEFVNWATDLKIINLAPTHKNEARLLNFCAFYRAVFPGGRLILAIPYRP